MEEAYLEELFNFGVVLRGKVKELEEIKAWIVEKYVDTGRVKLIKPMYEKKEIYVLTEEQWKEYQKLKQKDERLIGAGFP